MAVWWATERSQYADSGLGHLVAEGVTEEAEYEEQHDRHDALGNKSWRTIERVAGPNGRRAVAAANEDEDDGRHTPDSSAVFHTDGGRIVLGGGGIHPDLVVPGDTLSSAEQEFVRTLGSKLPVYRDVMTSYALELKGSNAVQPAGVRVTDRMRAELLRRLREKSVTMPDDAWAGARSLVDQQFGYEVIRYVAGREAESLQRIRDDVQVQRAVALLSEARTPQELLAQATQEARRSNP